MIALTCPKCKIALEQKENILVCSSCDYILNNQKGVYTSRSLGNIDEKNFYDQIYDREKGGDWIVGLKNESFFKKVLEKISLSYRRERFFKQNIKGYNNLILDLACGAGRGYFKDYGEVVGIDLSIKPLEVAKNRYDMVILGSAIELPFSDNSFDYVVSSDFFGHIKDENKDEIIKEIYRILKPGGKTLHIIETDSKNRWFKFAHKYPELFQKYFIEQIGGHIGLEMPDQVVGRWKKNNFEVAKAIKIWGLIWPIQGYNIFDNEYQEKSHFVKLVVIISKMLSKFRVIREFVNIILNPLNSIIETLTEINHGQGLMIVCKKK